MEYLDARLFLFSPTCMQAWQRQFLPVNVTRSPVGKGRLHRAQVKQAFLKKEGGGNNFWIRSWSKKEQILKIEGDDGDHLVESISKRTDHFSLHKKVAFCALGPKICLKFNVSWGLCEKDVDDEENDDVNEKNDDGPDNTWCKSSANLVWRIHLKHETIIQEF